jgi:acetylornithine deacetylase
MTDTTRLLRDLVGLPSVNPMGRPLDGPDIFEYQVTAYLEDFFRSLGVPCERQPVAPRRDNIVARYTNPNARRTILLEAHQDTVPAEHMTIEPFAARTVDGRLYGRGACDVKGGMAAMLAAFARVVREQPAGAANVILAATVDEEHTFLGVQRLVRGGRLADMAVVAEPTHLQIVNAHKGVVRWDLVTKGKSCHSSRPELGVNAIYHMAGVLIAVEQYAEWLRLSRTDPQLGPATLSVGRIEGGVSTNTVPDRCRIEVDRRLLPGEEPRAALEDLMRYLRETTAADLPVEASDVWLSSPALGSAGSEEVVSRLGAAIDAVRGSHRVVAVPYGTDASTIATVGIPVVIFGPGDITQAHTTDEWIELEQVAQAAEILYRMVCTA